MATEIKSPYVAVCREEIAIACKQIAFADFTDDEQQAMANDLSRRTYWLEILTELAQDIVIREMDRKD